MTGSVKHFKGVIHEYVSPVTLAYTGLGCTMVAWGMVPVFLKKLLTVLSPTELSFSRFLLSGAVLFIWLMFSNRSSLFRIFRSDLQLLVLCTIFGPLTAMVCFNFAIEHITVGTASVFAAIEPLCTYILAVIIGQEIWKTSRMLSILVALIGITLVVFSRDAWGPTYWVSIVLVTVSPMVWAGNNIITKELVKRHAPVVVVATSFVLSSLFLIPTLSTSYFSSIFYMGLGLWLAMIYCIISNIIGFTIWYWSMRHLPPSTVAVSMYIIPIFSVMAGMIFLGEPMSLIKATGIVTVLLGLFLVNVRFR